MRITLKSPAAGYSSGDTGEVPDAYARWLVTNGYAVEADDQGGTEQGKAEGDDARKSEPKAAAGTSTTKAGATRARRARPKAAATQGDKQAADHSASPSPSVTDGVGGDPRGGGPTPAGG